MNRLHSAGIVVLVVGVVAAVLVAVGRHERSHEQAYSNRGIEEVRDAIGPSLTKPGPTDYVQNLGLTCLLWASGGRSYALELCFDPAGRALEAYDRRGATTTIYSLTEEPTAAGLRISPSLVARLLADAQRPRRH